MLPHTFVGTDRNYRVDGIIGDEFQLSQMHILFAELGSDSHGGGLYTDVNIGGIIKSILTGMEISMKFSCLMSFLVVVR